jgi:hypothetical protein
MSDSIPPATATATSRRGFLKSSATVISATAIGTFDLRRNAHAAERADAPKSAAAADGSRRSSQGIAPRTIHPYPNKVSWGRDSLSFNQHATLTLGREVGGAMVDLLKETWRKCESAGLCRIEPRRRHRDRDCSCRCRQEAQLTRRRHDVAACRCELGVARPAARLPER